MPSQDDISSSTHAAEDSSVPQNEQHSVPRGSPDNTSPSTSPRQALSPRVEASEQQTTLAQSGENTEGTDTQRLVDRISELEARVRHLALHLAAVRVNVRADDGDITRHAQGVAGESPGILTLRARDLLPGDTVETDFFRRDMTQPEPDSHFDTSSESTQDGEIDSEETFIPGEPTYATPSEFSER